MKKIAATGIGIAALLAVGCTGASAATSPRPISPPAVHKTCESLDVQVNVKNGMPGDYVVNLCGPGMPTGSVSCSQPANVYGLPAPGKTLACGFTK